MADILHPERMRQISKLTKAPWRHSLRSVAEEIVTDLDVQEPSAFGISPIRHAPTSGAVEPGSHGRSHGQHRLHLPHRHHKKDEVGNATSKERRPSEYRDVSPHSGGPRHMTDYLQAPTSSPMPSGTNLSTRSTSPLPSEYSPSDGAQPKRKLFDKLRRSKGDKGDKGDKGIDQLKTLPGSQKSLLESTRDLSGRRDRDGSIATIDSSSTIRPTLTNSSDVSSVSQRKESTVRNLYNHARPRRFLGREGSSRDEDKLGDLNSSGNYWSLDTNLNDMEGIVDPQNLQGTPQEAILAGLNSDDKDWDAPDSWAVKKADDNMAQANVVHEDEAVPEEEDTGVAHGLRVFRIDSTFATLSTGVNTTASEILQILGRKSFLQDHLETYQIIMKKQDLQRQLRPTERPVAIQKRLLEQAGYRRNDRIEEVGREDNSYLCKFTFVPMKLSGYYSLEKDPGLSRLSKFRDIDLSGRSLVAIPIVLYSRSAEIVTLNLSRNLALDVPKDFVQGCTHLRTILFTGNEAWQLPPSFSLAIKLNYLDVSHNRLEQLEHANLENLTSLTSLKVSNNKLTALPPVFGRFMSLRKLNISSNSFTVFPDLLYDLENLMDLDISFNHIEKISRIGQLRSLERFVATNNQITGVLPNEFTQLEKLKELDIRHNGITNMDVISRLPSLEQLFIGNNSISKFEGSFQNLRVLTAERNPITRFAIDAPTPTLSILDLSDAKIVSIDDNLFERIPNLTKLVLDKNQFRSLPNQIGYLRRLNYLSISKNALGTFPANVGCLTELEILDAHECNIRSLPPEIWCCASLKSLNLASNVLEAFPKLTPSLQPPVLNSPSMQSLSSTANSVNGPASPNPDDAGRNSEDYMGRRPSQASTGLLSVGSSPANSTRKGSVASVHGNSNRKPSIVSRTNTNDGMAPISRKDSNITGKLGNTMASSLKHLSLSDNRLGDEIFEMITLLTQLRTLNLSYNELDDIPQNAFRKWPNLQELYLSGNDLRSLPTEDLLRMETFPLRVLHLNSNKFQVLPAELGKMNKLSVLDVGSNSLKYNVTNWRYDWNWNSNQNLKYLNFSGNKRLEIKPNTNSMVPGSYHEMQDLTNFNRMHSMRILGLMDVTLMIPSVPDQTSDRRVRSSDTQVGSMTYGMADTLGRNDHLSIIDLLIGTFRGHDAETVVAMFDGQSMASGGSKVAKFLAENFSVYLADEMDRLQTTESPTDGLRRTFLALNKELASTAAHALDEREKKVPAQLVHRGSTTAQALTFDDVRSGGVATVIFLDNMELYVANVGDAQALLMQSSGSYKVLTEKHHPAQKNERERIREAGGYVSRFGKLNDSLEVSRAFGYVHLMPAVMASPSICHHTVSEQDELIVVASRELWEYISPDVATDVARSERTNTMRAAEKLRDLAISFGATNKIMVMVLGVADLKRREKIRNRGNTLSMGPSQFGDDEQLFSSKPRRRDRHGPDDSKLGRLDQEVDAPQGELSLVFTDIKSSTALWEYNPVAMQAGIKIHNDLLRRQLRIIGGYEVKTEGDAFMVAFPTATSALLWCFTVQKLLLEQPWPTEIVESPFGKEVLDADGNVIFRGLSVRMGAHWGSPVCEPDPITRRMDYFGPMVNRASRISSVADGGQLTVSTDFITEIQRTLETYQELDRSSSTGSEDTMIDDALAQSIRRDLRAISTQGFEVKDLGERKLKGLENPEFIYMMYPHSLAGRMTAQRLKAEAEAAAAATEPAGMAADSTLSMEPDHVWDLWRTSLRLEMLISSLEMPGTQSLRPPETAIMERIKNKGGEVSDQLVVQFLEHLTVRIEVSLISCV
jgi:adenylate cyclase